MKIPLPPHSGGMAVVHQRQDHVTLRGGPYRVMERQCPKDVILPLRPLIVVQVGHVTASGWGSVTEMTQTLGLPAGRHYLYVKKRCNSNLRTFTPLSVFSLCSTCWFLSWPQCEPHSPQPPVQLGFKAFILPGPGQELCVCGVQSCHGAVSDT